MDKKNKVLLIGLIGLTLLLLFKVNGSSKQCEERTKALEERVANLEKQLLEKDKKLKAVLKEKEKLVAKLKEIEEKIKKANKALRRKGIKITLPQGGLYITDKKDIHLYAEKLDLNLEKILKTMEDYPVGIPLYGRITSRFGWRKDPFTGKRAFHTGLDFRASYKQPIFATASGKVVYAGWARGYGRMVKIRHKHGYTTLYAHMFHIKVKSGQWVKAGQIIGYAGSTGRSTGVHLHYEIRRYGKLINPIKFLYLNNKNTF